MNQIKIEYDPYKQEISYQFLGSDGWENLSDESKLSNDDYQKVTLQSKIDDILVQIISAYATDSKHSVGIVFCGTDEDYSDLKDAIARNPQVISGKATVYPNKDLESFYHSASVVSKEIDRIFESLGNSLRQNDEVQDILRQYDDAASNSIPLCVMGLYSSGKSMFINALIGEEILPSGSDPLTAQIFKVKPSEHYRVSFSTRNTKLQFEIKDQRVNLLNREDCSQCAGWIRTMTGLSGATNAEIMRQMIKKLNDAGKLECEAADTVSGLITVEVPFLKSILPMEDMHFEIYDTPGSDSAHHKEHFDVLKEALKERTNGLPILITKRDGLDKVGIPDLLNELNDSEIKLDRDNLMILINQADQEGCNALEEFHKKPPETVVTLQKKSSIMFISSAVAVGCKKSSTSTPWSDDRCRRVYKDNKVHFSNPDDEDYLSLPQYSILPRSRYDDLIKEAHELEKLVLSGDTSEEIICELIAQNSGIRGAEREIIHYAKRFSDYNKCKMAVGYLNQAIQKVVNRIGQELVQQATIKTQLSNNRDQIRERLCQDLNTCKEKTVEDAANAAPIYLTERDKKKRDFQLAVDATIVELCKAHKKDKKYAKLEKEINSVYSGYAKKYRDAIHEISVEYWQIQEGKLKDALIEIVNGDHDIPDEEREILRKTISDYPAKELSVVSVDLREKHIIQAKRLFGIFKIGEKIDMKKCQEVFGQAFNDICKDVVSYTREAHKAKFILWSKNLIQAVTEKLDFFNEKLRSLNEELRKSEEILNTLEQEKTRLTDADKELQSILSRQEG